MLNPSESPLMAFPPPATPNVHGGRITAQPELQIPWHLGTVFTVDGSATINAIGPAPPSVVITLDFTGAPTFKASSRLVIPGGADVAFAAGDTVSLMSRGNGVWRVLLNGRSAPRSKSADFGVVSGDIGATFLLTGTHALSLAAASALGAGWSCRVRNAGTGIWQVYLTGAETIDGQAAIYLYTGESCTIICNGANFFTIGRSTGLVLISTQIGSGVASIGFITGITSDFNEYEFRLSELSSSYGSATAIHMRLAQGGGFQSGAGAYAYGDSYVNSSAASFDAGSASDTKIVLNTGVVNTAGCSFGGNVRLFVPAGTSMYKRVSFDMLNYNGGFARYVGGATLNTSTDAVWGAQFFLANGNLSGTISMYGVRK